jgi:hypothetical protein
MRDAIGGAVGKARGVAESIRPANPGSLNGDGIRTDEIARVGGATTPLSPGRERLNGVVSNFPEFQQTFNWLAGIAIVTARSAGSGNAAPDRLHRPHGFVRHRSCSGFAGFSGNAEFCQHSRGLSRGIRGRCIRGRSPHRPGHRPKPYFLAGAGGAAAVSWWKTATHFPFRSVHTVDA